MSKAARVIYSSGSSYEISDLSTGKIFVAVLRGRIRLKGVRSTNPVAVGDIVDYEQESSDMVVITAIHERKNYIIRKSTNLSKESHILASNIDTASIVVSLVPPVTNLEFIDRFLVTAEAYGIKSLIIINKADATDTESDEFVHFCDTYHKAGYDIIAVSAREGTGIPRLKDLLHGKTTLLTGNSGVGKSSLINALNPTLNVQTGDISKYHHRGKHTTTYSRMYEIDTRTYIIDIPGVKGFGLIDIKGRELYHYFPEMMKYSPDCRYYNCTHIHEPGCAVREAVENDCIGFSRYENYLKILEEDDKYRI